MGNAATAIVAEPRAQGEGLELALHVIDPEVLLELQRHDQGMPREQFALAALRLGVLALRQAAGSVDAERIRHEGERLVAEVRQLLTDHSGTLTGKLAGAIGQYFDPHTGDLPQRLDRLVRKDGDLEQVLGRYLDGETSALSRTLSSLVGESSPLFKQLSPGQSDGFLASVRQLIEAALQTQREHLLHQFSLDDKASALSRLVAEITGSNGLLRDELARDMDVVRKEFSLDHEDGALSRLVRRVDETTSQVRANLTLDVETSPLALLRRELLDVIGSLTKANEMFHLEVKSTLEAVQVRRAEAARSTRHGIEFEAALGIVLTEQLRHSGDLLEPVGTIVGRTPRCKVGDFVLTLGAESAAPETRIVIEAKDDRSFNLRKLLDEVAEARENRDAQVGIVVLSKTSASEDMEPLVRFGPDILVVWDRDDTASDVLLQAALSLARALVIRERAQQDRAQAEFAAIEDVARRIARAAESLAEIVTMAGTIRSHGEKIRTRAEKLQGDIEQQLAVLRDNLDGLKATAVAAAA